MLRAEVEEGRLRRKRAEHEQRELDEARRIQRKLLPTAMPTVEGWEIAASWQPATGVGGDCYDAIPFGRCRLGLSIADVVGKGIPAALLMSNLQAAVRAFATDAAQPAELCQQVNRILCGRIAEDRFISFFYCVDRLPSSGTLTFANAGHYAPVLVRADGAGGAARVRRRRCSACSRTASTARSGSRSGAAIDWSSSPTASPKRATQADEEFGEDRLVALAPRASRAAAPRRSRRASRETVSAFTAGRFQDDATLIVMAAD